MKRVSPWGAALLAPIILASCPQPVFDPVPPTLSAVRADATICDDQNLVLETTIGFSFSFTGVVRGFTAYLTPATFDADNDPNTPPVPVTDPKALPTSLRSSASFSGFGDQGVVSEVLIIRPGQDGMTLQAVVPVPTADRFLWIEARNTAGASNLVSSAPIRTESTLACTSSDERFGLPKIGSFRTQTKYCSGLSGTPRSRIDFEFQFQNTVRGFDIAFTPALKDGSTPTSPNDFPDADVLRHTVKRDGYRDGVIRTAFEVVADKDGGVSLAGVRPNAIAVGRDSRLWVRAFNDLGRTNWLRGDVIEISSDSSICDPDPPFAFFALSR